MPTQILNGGMGYVAKGSPLIQWLEKIDEATIKRAKIRCLKLCKIRMCGTDRETDEAIRLGKIVPSNNFLARWL